MFLLKFTYLGHPQISLSTMISSFFSFLLVRFPLVLKSGFEVKDFLGNWPLSLELDSLGEVTQKQSHLNFPFKMFAFGAQKHLLH